LRSASVLALPSVEVTCYGKPVAISELLSLTAIEAMASGTPVVASRVGGVPEVVADGETGLLVDPGDVEALRDGLSRLLGDPASAARMGRAGRDLVHERFTWPECARRAAAAYEEMLKMGGATADSLFGMPGSGKTPSNDPPSVPEA
jgi:glycosyltransferase involved in cell wall biosynthesis